MLGLLGFLMPAGKMSRDVVNLLVSDKASQAVSTFMAAWWQTSGFK